MLDYMINPIKMGGLVKGVNDDQIKVHLHGRLGVITVPNRLVTTKKKRKLDIQMIKRIKEKHLKTSLPTKTQEERN